MKNENKKSKDATLLRQKAEQLLKEKLADKSVSLTEAEASRSEADTIKLLYELEVHQIELEMQNEELQLAKEKAETVCEKYTNLYDFAPSGYFTLDSEFRICKLNFNGAKMLGKERSKLINSHFNLFITPDKRVVFADFFNKVLETKTKQSCEVCFSINENATIYVHISGVFAETEQKCMLTVVDVSEIRKTEEALRKIEWMLTKKKLASPESDNTEHVPEYGDLTRLSTNRLILDAVGADVLKDIAGDYLGLLDTSSAVYEKNGDYALGIFSSGWCRYMDQASYNLCKTDNNVEALNSGKWLCHESCWKDASLAAINSGSEVDIECSGGLRLYAEPIKAGGKTIGAINFGYSDPPQDKQQLLELAQKYNVPVDELIKRAKEYETKPPYIIELAKNRLKISSKLIGEIVSRKITEQQIKKTNSELIAAKENAEKSEVQINTIIHTIPDLIWFKDVDGIYLKCNKRFEDFFGAKESEIIGKTDYDFVDKEMADFFRAYDEKAMKAGKPTMNIEHLVFANDGHKEIIETVKAPVYINGKTVGVLGIGRNITERKLAEVELIKAKEKAEESDRLKSAFLANMSHEIRTPMNGILGFAELLNEPNLSGEEQQEYIKVIEKSGLRMLNIINDIVSISKIESGLMEVNIQESNINDQVEYVYTFFKPEAEAKAIQFSYKNTLPYDESFVNTDKEKLFAVLTNLVKNAIKYTESGSIEFGYTKKALFLEFYVKDTGMGIDKHRQEAIFERFIQEDISDKKAFQGAGLGLSISKAYVEMLGGKLWVESEKRKGSIFCFTIPYALDFKESTEKTSGVDPKELETQNAKLKILIVEDDETSDMLMSYMIKSISRETLHAKATLYPYLWQA